MPWKYKIGAERAGTRKRRGGMGVFIREPILNLYHELNTPHRTQPRGLEHPTPRVIMYDRLRFTAVDNQTLENLY